ncbi:MAG TPA: hypothetical protein DDX19_09380 [Rhodopirellula baltica]|uniref:Uncharacterized protein n=1 Tax=Rhodopirellula baltica (strain DSM 10527 / NCIMB 13988 / SH1) TaxID=243090 RepID=Q7UU20_RHOBA|nr:hypothetical protein-signal peptide and transmembrane prediction [Rhodopirellula baltica SH 1]HBE62935.1 hypothetical protein [Rhodopirellula baltica]
MKRGIYSLRMLLLCTSLTAFVFALNHVASPVHSRGRYLGPLPDRCLREPGTINFGWPVFSRTDRLANHPRHETGPCEFKSTYHPIGIACNLAVAVLLSSVIVCSIVTLPDFVVWRLELSRERQMIERFLRDRSDQQD